MERRSFMGAIVGLANAQWEAEGYEPDNIENWDPIGGCHTTGEFSPESVSTSGDGIASSWLVEDEVFEYRSLAVRYDSNGIQLIAGANGGAVRTSMATEHSPSQAREMAVALFQAAEEYERRPKEDTDE